jgi:hypothetical protein
MSSDKSIVDLFSDSPDVYTVLRVRIRNHLFYHAVRDITWMFHHGACSKAIELFRSKDHKAPVLCVFTAVESDKLQNVLHIKGIQFLHAQIEDVFPCHLQPSTDIEMD